MIHSGEELELLHIILQHMLPIKKILIYIKIFLMEVMMMLMDLGIGFILDIL